MTISNGVYRRPFLADTKCENVVDKIEQMRKAHWQMFIGQNAADSL